MGRRTITMSGGITLFIEAHGDGTARRQVRPSRCPACLRNVTATDQDHQVEIYRLARTSAWPCSAAASSQAPCRASA